MSLETVLPFVGQIVGACIAGGAIHAGLVKIAEAVERSSANRG